MTDHESDGTEPHQPIIDRNLTLAEIVSLAKKQWYVPVVGISTVAGLVSNVIPFPVNIGVIFAASVLFVIGAIASRVIHPNYLDLMRLKAKYDQDASDRQANFRVIFGALLSELANDVGINNSNARVSGYSHTGEAFVMLGRVSSNPNLKKAGRGVYPQDKGLIAKVWEQGSASCVRLPPDLENYVAKMDQDYGLPGAVTRALTMRSRSLAGIRVTDKDGTPVGVVIAESLTPQGVSKSTIEKIEKSEIWKTICHQMIASRELLPDMLSVSREGF